MANPVIMPRQGQSVESCIITTWHKKVGDTVNEGDVLFSYETDKSAFDEKSLFSGTLLKILFEEGDVVPCLETVCFIGEAGEDVSSLGAPAAAEEKESAPEKAAEPAAAAAQPAAAAPAAAAPAAAAEGIAEGGRVKISPRAKNLALKTGVDMTAVGATGPHGRIIERDINAALDRGAVGTVARSEERRVGKECRL